MVKHRHRLDARKPKNDQIYRWIMQKYANIALASYIDTLIKASKTENQDICSCCNSVWGANVFSSGSDMFEWDEFWRFLFFLLDAAVLSCSHPSSLLLLHFMPPLTSLLTDSSQQTFQPSNPKSQVSLLHWNHCHSQGLSVSLADIRACVL